MPQFISRRKFYYIQAMLGQRKAQILCNSAKKVVTKMLTITVPCSNDLTTSVTLCLWSHKHLGILQQWWSSGSKAAAAMTVAVTSTGTLGGNKALSMLSRLYWPCLLLLAEIAWKNSHAVQERLLTRNPKEFCMDHCLSSDQCCSHKPLHNGTSSKSFWKINYTQYHKYTQGVSSLKKCPVATDVLCSNPCPMENPSHG